MTESLSVVIPCHNGGPHLAQTLGSVLEQSLPPDEILVMDDSSTDDSLSIAQAFGVRAVSCSFQNAARTRHRGAILTSGEALMFLDADDVLGPTVLESLASALATVPDGIALGPWRRLEHCQGRWLDAPPSCRRRSPGQDILAGWLENRYHPPCSVLWSREAYRRSGGWDPLTPMNDDGDLVMRALIYGVPAALAQTGTSYYRRAPADRTSLSDQRFSPGGLRGQLRVLEKLEWLLQEHGRLDFYRGSLCVAYRKLAADARGQDEACLLRAQAGFRRHHRPVRALLERARKRLSRRVPAARVDTERTEIRYGLDLPHRIEEAPSAPEPPPVVTVIVPTYNRVATLERAVRSVLCQSFGDFELLVVDDGSTDSTPELMETLKDERLRYLRQPRNAGVSAARNRGMREARGELIAFLDSDDEWMPEKLELQVKRFRELPEEVGLLYTGVECVLAHSESTVREPAFRGDVFARFLERNRIHGCSGVMIRRAVVATIGFFDEKLPAIEDYDYWVRVARFFRIDYLREPLMRYYESVTIDRKSLDRDSNLEARDQFYRKHAREMRRFGVAHKFLLQSARRQLGPNRHMQKALWLALMAWWERPLSGAPIFILRHLLLPALRGKRP